MVVRLTETYYYIRSGRGRPTSLCVANTSKAYAFPMPSDAPVTTIEGEWEGGREGREGREGGEGGRRIRWGGGQER